MCGIVGYVGRNEAAPILLEGLSRLEYRGYDSAGICVEQNGVLEVAKAKGRLQNLIAKTDGGAKLPGTLGIGHTRWATHGEPNDINSHPHVSQNGKIAVVHNGIIETISRSANFCRRRACSSPRRPTRRSSRSSWNTAWACPRSRRSRTLCTWSCTGSRARTPSASSARTIRIISTPRARTRRCCSASARARISSPPT